MNRRTFDTEGYYYKFRPPWFYEHTNILKRSFRLNDSFEEIIDALDTIRDIERNLEKEGAEPEDVSTEFGMAVGNLITGLEEFAYCFKDIHQHDWFHSLWQAAASAYWRDEEGWFENEPWRIRNEIDDITAHISEMPAPGPYNQFERFIEQRGRELAPDDVSSLFTEDVYEARDLLAIGYYSTALLVLGRAVEKGLLIAGRERKIESITAFGQNKSWEDTRFYERKEAMSLIDRPTGNGKMISQKQYHEISILVDYRNNVAHSDYEDIGRDEATRQAENAVDLLQDFTELIDELRQVENDKIDSITDQKVN